MVTKEDLRKCRDIKLQLNSIIEQIREIRIAMAAPKTSNFSSVPGGYGGSDGFLDAMARAEQLKKLYWGKYKELLELQTNIEEEAAQLSGEEQALLRWYYFTGCTWEQTAEKLHYSRSQVHRKHNEILKKLAPR